MSASTFLSDVIFLLEQAGLGAYGVDIFKGSKASFPPGNGPFISVIPTGGLGDEGTHNLSRDDVAYERPSAQIVCRAESFDVADAAAQVAYNKLNFVDAFVQGTYWRKIAPKQEPFDLGPDERGLARSAFNIDSVKRVSPATS